MIRKEDGSLHFFVNSTDLGCAAHGVPADVYGVVDLFGQCAQVTIVSGTQENGEVDLTNSLNGKNPENSFAITAYMYCSSESSYNMFTELIFY